MTSLSHQDLKKQRLMVVYAKEKKKKFAESSYLWEWIERFACRTTNSTEYYKGLLATSASLGQNHSFRYGYAVR